MRRFLSILLLTVFGLPLASPVFALSRSAGMGVRACCRRAGMHHCMDNMQPMSADASTPRWTSPPDQCPFAPHATPAVHLDLAGPPTSAAAAAFVLGYPRGLAQAQSKRRIAQLRSHQKRGPPALSLL